MSNLIVPANDVLEIPQKRFMVAVILNAEISGRRVHIMPNVPDTEMDKILKNLYTIGLQLQKNDTSELIVLPSGILAIEITELKDPEPITEA